MCALSLVTALSGSTENYLLFTKTHKYQGLHSFAVFGATQFVYVLRVFKEQTSAYLMVLILILGTLWLKLAMFVNVRCGSL